MNAVPVRLNGGSLRFDEHIDTNLYRTLYKTSFNRATRSLEYVPVRMTGQIYIFYWDMCGRLEGGRADGATGDMYEVITLPVSLTDIAGIQKTVLNISTSEITDGEYNEVINKRNENTSKIAELQRDINRLENAATTANYQPNILCTTRRYTLDSNRTRPIANNTANLDAIEANAIRNVISSELQAIPGFNIVGNRVDTQTSSQYTFWVWEGFLKIPKDGAYRFYINSDDAGEIFIDNRLAAHHYGYHATDNRNLQTTTTFNFTVRRNPYVSIRIRVYNHEGPGGIHVYWNAGEDSPNFVYIPQDAYFHNANLQEAIRKRRTLEDMRNAARRVDEYINIVNQNMRQTIESLPDRLKGPKFMQSRWTAKFLSGIDPRNSAERCVYVNFPSMQGTFTEVPPSSDGAQVLHGGPTSINRINLDVAVPTGINMSPSANVRYTVSFALFIDGLHNAARSIFTFGHMFPDRGNDFDRTPKVDINPNRTSLSIRHASDRNWNDGIDATSFNLPLQTWCTVTIAVNNTFMDVYLDGTSKFTFQLPARNRFVWRSTQQPGIDVTQKKMVLNSNMRVLRGNPTSPRDVIIKNFIWFNDYMTQDAIINTIITNYPNL